jgi:hypothetical protein
VSKERECRLIAEQIFKIIAGLNSVTPVPMGPL